MKHMVNIVILLPMIAAGSMAQTTQAELFVEFLGPAPADYRIAIQPVSETSVYDEDLQVVTDPDVYEEKSFRKVDYNAVYSSEDDGTNGTVYYGIYRIRFVDESLEDIDDPRYIDFRDAGYGRPSGPNDNYANQDFFLFCEFSETSGGGGFEKIFDPGSGLYFSIYWKHIATTYGGLSYGIWEFESLSQVTSGFQNLVVNTTGVTSGCSYNITINSVNYPRTGNASVGLFYPFGSNQNVSVTVPNEIGSSVPHNYFTGWSDLGNNYNTNRTESVGDRGSQFSAIYTQSYQSVTISGPYSFDKKMSLTYTATPTVSRAWQDIEYFWYVRYDFNGVWQYVGVSRQK